MRAWCSLIQKFRSAVHLHQEIGDRVTQAAAVTCRLTGACRKGTLAPAKPGDFAGDDKTMNEMFPSPGGAAPEAYAW